MPDVPESWRVEVEGILAEIASDPKAKLLRIPPIEKLFSLAKQPPVGVMSPDLTKAERHLLQSYRHELAFLLRERCVMELFADPDADRKWHRSVSAREDLEVADEPDWCRRAAEVRDTDLVDPRSADATHLLDACTAVPGRHPGVQELALASQRVAPTDEARIYVALSWIGNGDVQRGRELCEEVAETTSSEFMRSAALENVAHALTFELEWLEAARSYRGSFEADPDRVAPAVFGLNCSILAGDSSLASDAARIVDDVVPQGHPVVDWTVRATVDFVHAAVGLSIPNVVIEVCGENSARVLNAFRA